MAVEEDLKTELSSVVSGRVYLEKLPRNPTYPCVVITRTGTNPNTTLSGHVNKESAFFQLDVYAETPTAKQVVIDSIRAAMVAATAFNAIFEGQEAISYDDNIPIFRSALDYTVWYDYTL